MVGSCNERGRGVLNLFGLIATLSLLGCSLGMAHSWSLDVCQNFSGSCIAFEMVMVLFLVREIAAPLSEEVVNFSISCSCSMCALFAGLYACAVVGISITAQTQDWQVVGVCAPAPFVYIVFGFNIAGSFYITAVIACAVAQLDAGNRPQEDHHSRQEPQAQNSQARAQLERWQHRGLSTQELAIIPRYFIPSHSMQPQEPLTHVEMSPCLQHTLNTSGTPERSETRKQIAVVITFPEHRGIGTLENHQLAHSQNSQARLQNSQARLQNSQAHLQNSQARLDNSQARLQNSQAHLQREIPIGRSDGGAVEVRSACAICLGDCDGWVRQLRCGHRFHVACIDQWLSKRNSCVLCRAPATLCPISQNAPSNRP